jgi:SulP family sulfate permease
MPAVEDVTLAPADSRRVNLPPSGRLERAFPFVRTLRGYRREYLRRDFVAGLTTALFAVPQGMAYALIAGFPPAAGIATSMAASILGAAFGSSEFLINGPTNAISVMIAGNAALFAANGDPVQAVILLTMVVGVIQIIAGLMRVGSFTRFVSEPVLTGFTAGAGLYIVINQIPAFLGLERAVIAHDLWGWVPPKCAIFDLARVLRSLHGVHVATVGLSVATFLGVRALQRLEGRLGRKVPAPFLAVLAVTIAAWALGLSDPAAANRVQVVRDIEPLTRSLPTISLPSWSVDPLRSLFGPAFAIALMGAVEAIAIGKMLAAKAGHPFDASRQLIGEGFCNLGASFVGGFASSGSFSRTAVNHEAGAETRISCILSGVLVMAIVVLFAPQANLIPIAALAGTLAHIGLKLVDVARLRAVFQTTTGDRAVLVTTFGAVLFAEHLEYALFLGVGVSIFYALLRAEGFKLRVLLEGGDGSLYEPPDGRPIETSEVTLLNLQGELFFAAAEELQTELTRMLDHEARFLVLRVQEAYNLDATTAEALAHVAKEARERGGRLILCGVRPGMYGTLERAGLLSAIGEDAILRAEGEVLASTRRAIRLAHELAAASDRASRAGDLG